jgi:hypothetical protein
MKQFLAFMLATNAVPSVVSGFGKFGQRARDNLARREKAPKKAEASKAEKRNLNKSQFRTDATKRRCNDSIICPLWKLAAYSSL